MKRNLLFLLVFASGGVFAERQPYERYQSVVDRQMFGPLPANFDPTKSPSEIVSGRGGEKTLSKEQEQLKSAIHFSMINVTPDGATAVGFTDNSNAKTPVHYYLKVGESRDGWLVKEADAKTATMTVAKDDIEVTLTIGGDSSKGSGTTAKSAASANAGGMTLGGPQGLLSSRMGSGLGLNGNTLMSRRRQRIEQQKAAQAAAVAERERLAAEKEEEKARNEQEKVERQREMDELREVLRKQNATIESLKKESVDSDVAEGKSERNENNDPE